MPSEIIMISGSANTPEGVGSLPWAEGRVRRLAARGKAREIEIHLDIPAQRRSCSWSFVGLVGIVPEDAVRPGVLLLVLFDRAVAGDPRIDPEVVRDIACALAAIKPAD